jgi:RHS repeat-associated protein
VTAAAEQYQRVVKCGQRASPPQSLRSLAVRRAGAVNKNSSGVVTRSATYFYDDQGNPDPRISPAEIGTGLLEEITVTGTNAPVTTYYLVGGNNPTGYAQVIEQGTTPGTPAVTYIWGESLIQQDSAPGTTNAGTYYLIADGQGSTQVLVNSTDSVVQNYYFDGFGNAVGFTVSSAITDYLYNQQFFDIIGGQYYFRARNYDPATGTFTQQDSYAINPGDLANANLYLYAGADPINMIDPSGHISMSGTLAAVGISSLLISIAIPSIHGAWESAYHVTANGTTESLFSAIFDGDVTPSDWERVLSGLGGGAGAGAVNVLDALTFHQVNPLDQYRNELWKQQGLENSWVGSTADGFAWAGTGLLYSAAAVWTWGAFGGGTMDIAVTKGAAPFYIHVLYGVNGAWQSAVLGTGLLGLGGMTVVNEAAGTAESGFQLTGIPVLRPGLVLAGDEAGYAYSCVTAALHAFVRGWGGW